MYKNICFNNMFEITLQLRTDIHNIIYLKPYFSDIWFFFFDSNHLQFTTHVSILDYFRDQ